MISSYMDLKTGKAYKMLSPALVIDDKAPPYYFFPEDATFEERQALCEKYTHEQLTCKFYLKVSPQLFVNADQAKQRFGSRFVSWPAEDCDGKPIQIRAEVKE